MTKFDQITSNPTIVNGQPTIRGMRLSVRRVIEALAVYPNWDDLRREYPELEPEDIRQALEFAARNLDESIQPLELCEATPAGSGSSPLRSHLTSSEWVGCGACVRNRHEPCQRRRHPAAGTR